MDLQETEWGAWTGLIWRRIGDRWRAVVNAVMTLGFLKRGEFVDLVNARVYTHIYTHSS